MIIIPSPQDKKFTQANQGDFVGNIKQSKNIDFFTNPGYIKLSNRTRMISDSSTLTNLTQYNSENIQKIVFYLNKIWVAGTKSLYSLDPITLVATQDVTSGTPSLSDIFTDMCSFKLANGTSYLCVTNYTSGIYYYNGITWATITTTASGSYMCIFENLTSLAVAGDNKVQLVDGTMTASTVLTLPSKFVVTSMAWNNNLLYIGALDQYGGDGGIFTWDGQSALANDFFPCKGYPMSLVRYELGVAYVTTRGLLMYIENTPKEIAQFPIYNSDKIWLADISYVSFVRRVLHGGMTVDKELIYIGVDSLYQETNNDDTQSYYNNDFPSGVWCYDPSVGLHHKYSVGTSLITNTGAITTSNVNTSTGIITIPSSICPATGTPVFYNDGNGGQGTLLAPLSFSTRYFVINLSGTTLQLATTYANALNGVYITLTDTGNNAQYLQFCPNDDFGGMFQKPRALYLMLNNYGLPPSYIGSKLLIGSYIAKTAGSFVNTGIHAVEDKQENRGYFLTTRQYTSKPTTFGIQIPTVTGVYAKCFIKFRPLVNPDDAIIVKWRKVKTPQLKNKLVASTAGNNNIGTWVTSTTFTTAIITGMLVGNEIEIVDGAGSGYLAHITNISTISGGVYTITIDETVQNITAGQTFDYTVDNWTKIPIIITTAYSTNNDGYAELPITTKGTAIELKVELRGIDVMIEEIQVISEPYKESV